MSGRPVTALSPPRQRTVWSQEIQSSSLVRAVSRVTLPSGGVRRWQGGLAPWTPDKVQNFPSTYLDLHGTSPHQRIKPDPSSQLARARRRFEPSQPHCSVKRDQANRRHQEALVEPSQAPDGLRLPGKHGTSTRGCDLVEPGSRSKRRACSCRGVSQPTFRRSPACAERDPVAPYRLLIRPCRRAGSGDPRRHPR